MSWDSYVENRFAQTRDPLAVTHCDGACIIGLNDGAPWTTAGRQEKDNIAGCFKAKYFSAFW